MITVKLTEWADAVELFAREDGDKGEKERFKRIAMLPMGFDFDKMTHDRALGERFDVTVFECEPIERHDKERDFIFFDPGPFCVRLRASREDGKAAIRALAEELST